MTLTFENPDDFSADEQETGSSFAPKFDAKGLVTAVAVDKETGAVLMLAHMNAEALSLTLETGMAHYFSRSRSKIWKKGETSGETQKLVEMRVDCDQDAILMVVQQNGKGAACHTGRKSCFFRVVEKSDGKATLRITGDAPLFDPKKIYG